MHVVGHGDIDRIDTVALFLEHFPPIAVLAGVWDLGSSAFEHVFIDVADCYDLEVWVLEEVVQIANAHSAHADASVLQLAIGRSAPDRMPHDIWRSQNPNRRTTEKLTPTMPGTNFLHNCTPLHFYACYHSECILTGILEIAAVNA
jgi:hypothetical protein